MKEYLIFSSYNFIQNRLIMLSFEWERRLRTHCNQQLLIASILSLTNE